MASESLRIDGDRSEMTEDALSTFVFALGMALGNAGTVTTAVDDDAYSVGTSTDNIVLQVKASATPTIDWSWRLVLDTGLSNNKKIEIITAIFNVVRAYFTIHSQVWAATYAAGNGSFDHTVTVT